MELASVPLLPFSGCSFLAAVAAIGRRRMLVRLLDAFTVQDGVGPEYDIGELVPYLNDSVLVAPSMLLFT